MAANVEGPSVLESSTQRFALVQPCTVPYSGPHVVACEGVEVCQAYSCDT